MPIRIDKKLPAVEILQTENIFVMDDQRAAHQDIRPLKILILNLMPQKIVTETQLLRHLANTPLLKSLDWFDLEYLLLKLQYVENVETQTSHQNLSTRDDSPLEHLEGKSLISSGLFDVS